jgi:hypothetical protein
MKTAKFNVKDVLGKLGFLKNNFALLVPILIALVAVLLFIPTRILRGQLETQIEQQSVKPGQQITRLTRDAGKAGEAAAMELYVKKIEQDANTVDLLAKQTTLRELLTYKLFPDTNERSTLLFEEVRQKFISGVEAMLQSKEMAAGTPPTDAEIEAALKNAPRPMGYGAGYGGAYGPGGGSMMPGGTPGATGYGRQRSWTIATETDRKILEKVCEDKARAAKVYVDPMSLDGYQYWNEWKFEDRDKAYRACWYWQLGYWILEDVAATVDAMNQNAQCVLDAPVKRVMNVSFNQKQTRGYPGMMGMGMRRGMRRTDKDKQGPIYVTSAKNAMASPPCTGRYTNEENDVVHFDVRVILEAQQVMPFIQQLCSAKEHTFRGFYGDLPEQKYKHNQITVLESTLTPVNVESWEHYLCRYGTEDPYELDLICEYLFDAKAYDQIKPQQVKEDIINANQKPQPGRR